MLTPGNWGVTQHLLVSSVRTIKRFDGTRSELDCAPRGRGSLILWLALSKGHSMAMRCSLNNWASARTVVIKLLLNYGPVSGSLCS